MKSMSQLEFDIVLECLNQSEALLQNVSIRTRLCETLWWSAPEQTSSTLIPNRVTHYKDPPPHRHAPSLG